MTPLTSTASTDDGVASVRKPRPSSRFSGVYNVNLLPHLPSLAVVMLLGTWALTVIGTMFSAMTVNLRLRELMLPTLLYPMLIPALLAVIQLTSAILSPDSTADNSIWY